MHLQRLAITGLRNLDAVDIALLPGANFFYGANGSGKTSILEAIYLLSRGRSFRTRNLRSVINYHQKDCTCFGALMDENGSGAIPIGVNRNSDGDFTFRIAGEQVRTASQLSELLPVQLLNSDSFQLVDGSPVHRRGFLDWGVFHVEHDYRHLWARFQRCLKHRNSLLRHGRIDPLHLAVWDKEFVQVSEQIAELRSQYLDELLPVFADIGSQLGVVEGLKLNTTAGWDRTVGLETLLQEGLERDRKVGHTQAGPHRADIRIQVEGKPAAELLSRGQAKILVIALKIAQGFLLKQNRGRQCIYLLDDLPAELDASHRHKVGALLQKMGVQVMITGVDRTDLEASWPESNGADRLVRVFHVEHGRVQDIAGA
jgi:DNA replication and repair protein RecF